MKNIRYFCEDCDTFFDEISELKELEVIGGYYNVMCCPYCQGSIEITVNK